MTTRKPDFSDVSGGSSSAQPPRFDTTGGTAPPGRADFSDVRAGSSSAPAARAGTRTHTVERGDTLSEIAQRVYGRASRWRAIFDANRDQLDDPDRIRPGQVLVIPDLPDDAR